MSEVVAATIALIGFAALIPLVAAPLNQ